MYLLSIFLIAALIPWTFGIEHQEKTEESQARGTESYFQKSDQEVQFIGECFSANLRVFVNPNYDLEMITVSFEFVESKHRNCFPYFDVVLHKDRRIFDSAKVPYSNEALVHTFKNVTCGSYAVSIMPCYNSWRCAPLSINYDKKISMCGFKREATLPSYFDLHLRGIYVREILAGTLISLLLLLVTVAVVYYRYIVKKRSYAGCSTLNLKELESQTGIEGCSNVNDVHREVFFINYHDKNTLEQVETLKNKIIANCPNTCITGIGCLEDYNDFLTDPCTWLDEKLSKPKQKNTVRKIILVDSAGKMDAEIHENENEAFIDAVEKLYRNFAGRRFDYANVFVVHFGHSRVGLEKLSAIVEDMRYLIPLHWKYLHKDLLSP